MYFKITSADENHHNLQYRDGFIADYIPFNDDPNASCCPGGIYFSDEKNILTFCEYGPWIRQVEVPEGARWLQDPQGKKWRAEKLMFHPRKPLFDVETIKWLMEQGVNLKASRNYFLYLSATYDKKEVVKFLIKNGANPSRLYESKLIKYYYQMLFYKHVTLRVEKLVEKYHKTFS